MSDLTKIMITKYNTLSALMKLGWKLGTLHVQFVFDLHFLYVNFFFLPSGFQDTEPLLLFLDRR